MKIVYIKWIDACFTESTTIANDVREEMFVESVGVYMKESKTTITMAQDFNPQDNTWRYSKSIPKRLIIKKRIIKL